MLPNSTASKAAACARIFSKNCAPVPGLATKRSFSLGHETIILAPGPCDREDVVAGGKIIWVKAPVLVVDPRYHIFVRGAAVRRILDREQPDVVEGSSPWRGGWIVATWPGRAVKSLFMHSDPVASYPHTVLRPVLSRPRIDALFGWFWNYLCRLNAHFDTTVVSGEWLAARFESFGLKKMQAVPLGVERRLFHGPLRHETVRREMLAACGLTHDAKILICVGRHHPEKHIGTMIDAVNIANRTSGQKVGLYIVGDGLSRKRVERKASTVPHVFVAGQITDRARVASLMASADALIHGCASETYGLAVAEALCAATPVSVPDAGGAFDLAGAAYAEVYQAGEPDSAAQAIARLLARPWAELSRAAAEAAAAKVGDAATHFDRLFAHYQTLVDARKAAP